jgi:N-acetylneuraminic acid mutarotase
MLMWGGHLQSSAVGDGARYAPSTDTWKPIAAGGPSSRSFHAGVWTGERFILWGGLDGNARFGDGAGYDPKTDSWTPVSPAGAPEARAGHTAVWTGTQMLVWGGSGVAGPLSTGGRYDPATDAWQPISPAGAPTPRAHFTAVWTGHKLVVWGGYKELSSGEPTTYVAFGDGAAYDPGTDTWSPLSTVGAPEPRSWHAGVWTGTQMLIWGGARTDWTELVTGGLYDPAFDTWEATAECGAAIAHRGFDSLFDSVWTGNELIVFGGGSTGTAGAYTPP